jgi:hypothetical protein
MLSASKRGIFAGSFVIGMAACAISAGAARDADMIAFNEQFDDDFDPVYEYDVPEDEQMDVNSQGILACRPEWFLTTIDASSNILSSDLKNFDILEEAAESIRCRYTAALKSNGVDRCINRVYERIDELRIASHDLDNEKVILFMEELNLDRESLNEIRSREIVYSTIVDQYGNFQRFDEIHVEPSITDGLGYLLETEKGICTTSIVNNADFRDIVETLGGKAIPQYRCRALGDCVP